jgi:hypothetical protein
MNQNQQANIGGGNSPGKAVGTDQAVDLIDQNRAMNLLEDPDAKQKLYQTYIENQEKLPEVIATKQKGFKHESALSQKKETLALTKHEHRRENDGEIIE